MAILKILIMHKFKTYKNVMNILQNFTKYPAQVSLNTAQFPGKFSRGICENFPRNSRMS